MLIIPDAAQLIPATVEHRRRMGFDMQGVLGNFAAQARIIGFCASNKLRVIDLTPALAASTNCPYLEVDGHWNQLGHRIAAEVLSALIEADR